MHLFVCLSVCLFVYKITQKVMNGFWWNFQERSAMVCKVGPANYRRSPLLLSSSPVSNVRASPHKNISYTCLYSPLRFVHATLCILLCIIESGVCQTNTWYYLLVALRQIASYLSKFMSVRKHKFWVSSVGFVPAVSATTLPSAPITCNLHLFLIKSIMF